MTHASLPPNVYRVAQRRFDTISGSPWVYWITDSIRALFERHPALERFADARQGLVTGDNSRFIRFEWECDAEAVQHDCRNRLEAKHSGARWFPVAKSGSGRKWLAPCHEVVKWEGDGHEILHFFGSDGRLASRPQNMEYYFLPGVAYSSVTSSGLSFRYLPQGYICEHATNAIYVRDVGWPITVLVGIGNSCAIRFLVGLSETININIGDLQRVPIPSPTSAPRIEDLSQQCIRLRLAEETGLEQDYRFLAPPRWDTGLEEMQAAQARLAALEAQIDEEVYRLYGISDEDRAALEAELAGGAPTEGDGEDETPAADEEIGEPEASMTRQELAVRWISYAVGIVLRRFAPGGSPQPATDGAEAGLGSAIYHREDFAIGSLPAPDEAEYNELVGPPDRFAYVDASGGRHLFSAEAEAALRALALADGIAVLDEGHPRDLPTLVQKALWLMLGEKAALDVITTGANGDLRGFLQRDFFTRWHLKWYRKRPVYWPLQSARRAYGFVLFHERIHRSTLYILMREYLDYKINGLTLRIGDLQGQARGASGAALKRVEREIDDLSRTLEEVKEFTKAIDRIVRAGYEPAPDWIDDGVILRMAPLWELVPIWSGEPKRHWERLQKGDFDWSHIAMRYWPERVKEKCKANKSFAIAHGMG